MNWSLHRFISRRKSGNEAASPWGSSLALVEGLRRIAPNLYLGLRAVYAETDVGPQLPDINLPPGLDPDLLRVDLTLATIAPRLQYDTRDNEFYPRSGLLIDATAAVSRDAIGADVDYERYDASMTHYLPIGNEGVLASRISTQ
ncbi:MAG: outer membrane protein assembly factor [Gammaproteobacteria bacterium]|nr:outer membrane protein assembly factor [Gammaproteobacteria bacterium]